MDVQASPYYFTPTCGIAAGATASTPILVGPSRLGASRKGAIALPSSWVTCTATFKAALTAGAAYQDLYAKDGTQAKIASAVASRTYELPDACLVGCYALKVVKSTKQTTTAGAAALATVLRD